VLTCDLFAVANLVVAVVSGPLVVPEITPEDHHNETLHSGVRAVIVRFYCFRQFNNNNNNRFYIAPYGRRLTSEVLAAGRITVQ